MRIQQAVEFRANGIIPNYMALQSSYGDKNSIIFSLINNFFAFSARCQQC